jgi:hypothetical protein
MKQLIIAEGIDEKRWPAALLAGPDRRLEEPRLTPEKVPAHEAAPLPTARASRSSMRVYQARLPR